MRIQEMEWTPPPPEENPIYQKAAARVKRCREKWEAVCEERAEADCFLADCMLLPSALKEEIRSYYEDALAAAAAEHTRARGCLLALGYDDYD